jgi:D-alanyl-lipoteichoic acid acyltransferase DltB (MBOAT superfamily)
VIFHSLHFVLFFIAFTILYWWMRHDRQNVLLLAGSYFFYGYIHPWFLILIATSTVIDFVAARGMDARPSHRKKFLWLSVATNFGMLGFFKYFNFFIENVHQVLTGLGLRADLPSLRVVLPVGISFYTFQAMSYTIDVYRGELRARRSLLDVAVFVSFFPHLVAGPIQRASFLLPQVETPRRFFGGAGAERFRADLLGLFQEAGDRRQRGRDREQGLRTRGSVVPLLWAGVFAFAIQIYADFSAYTDIARGTSRWLGFELTENFDHPYLARSPADFWRRWNISLSTWFRDYVYIPLGGSRAGEWKWVRNILATFLLSGLWHGASWNYVLWGAYHGVLLVLTRARPTLKPSAPSPTNVERRPLSRAIVVVAQTAGMFVLTLIGWLFFRETELAALFRDLQLSPWAASEQDTRIGVYLFLLAFLYSIALWVQSLWAEWHRDASGMRQPATVAPDGWPRLAVQGLACGAAFAAILVLRSQVSLDFIYFQF